MDPPPGLPTGPPGRPAHLSRLPGRKVLRLEALGLFARLRRFWCPKKEVFPPGLFWVRLHLRTDGEGFATSLHLAACRPLGEAPVGTLPGEPLGFTLLGEWLGAWRGWGGCACGFPGRSLRGALPGPEAPPPSRPGGWCWPWGGGAGRLLGEAVLRLPLPPSELPGAPLPASKGPRRPPPRGAKGEKPPPLPRPSRGPLGGRRAKQKTPAEGQPGVGDKGVPL
ncbi:hypothetical protein [Thermus amyloliquefaciens]|uniref:hypothetical protein n=1 Tax=Thermus amyloliquefaciens TaxID=1449080 RepID=UPI000A4F90DB|nr:hypothetical protein [Thermus amyloliquefaciens]